MTRAPLLAIPTLALALAAAAPAAADPVLVGFGGDVTDVEDPDVILGGDVSPGDRFDGLLRFDPAGATDGLPGDDRVGLYGGFAASPAVELSIGALDLELGDLVLQVADDFASGGGAPEDLLVASASAPLPAFDAQLELQLVDSTQSVFDSDALPAEPPPLSSWSAGSLVLREAPTGPGGPSPSIAGTVDRFAVVPEPASAALLAAGSAALAAHRRPRGALRGRASRPRRA